ncbi:Titin [Manis pentadactyla]|nr:Titin [Manis pentadactyla]
MLLLKGSGRVPSGAERGELGPAAPRVPGPPASCPQGRLDRRARAQWPPGARLPSASCPQHRLPVPAGGSEGRKPASFPVFPRRPRPNGLPRLRYPHPRARPGKAGRSPPV